MATAASPTTDSVRYQRLLEVLDLALKKARSQLEVETIVKDCYGDDETTVFQTLLHNVLENAHAEVTAATTKNFQEKDVESKLLRVDAAIQKLERDAAAAKRQEAKDKASAEAALQQAQLPQGVTAQDMVQFQAYQRMIQEKKVLEEEISAEEAAIAKLEAAHEKQSSTTGKRVQDMQNTSKELEKSADLCSMVS